MFIRLATGLKITCRRECKTFGDQSELLPKKVAGKIKDKSTKEPKSRFDSQIWQKVLWYSLQSGGDGHLAVPDQLLHLLRRTDYRQRPDLAGLLPNRN